MLFQDLEKQVEKKDKQAEINEQQLEEKLKVNTIHCFSQILIYTKNQE